jgi:hypothetical protein
MRRLRLLVFSLPAFLAAAAYWSCGGFEPLAGGTSETTNGFVAVVHGQNGAPVSRALVRLRPEDYRSDTAGTGVPYNGVSIIDTLSDSAGRFAFMNIDTGKYSVEIQDGMGGGALLRSSTLKDSIKDFGVVVVGPVVSITGFIDRKAVAESVTVYVRAYGMERLARADPATGIFVLSGMPQEQYSLYFMTSSPFYTPKEVPAALLSGSSIDIGRVALFPFSGWTFSRGLSFNTTPSGADVSGNVYDFPVLVRLADSTFTFSQTENNGGDLRFAKTDSTPLPYEIERWDAGRGLAEVWVRLDTVYGNSDTQTIVMYWGNPGAASESNSAAVFDTTNGFQGVWHLAGTGNTTSYDATINHYDGTPTGMTSASAVQGITGGAQNFDGSSSYITMANTANSKLNFPQNGTYSMSLWVYADTIDATLHVIAGKGHEQNYIKLKCFGNNRAVWEFVEFQDQQGWEFTVDSVPPAPGSKTWVNVAGVRNGTQQLLYINGSLVNSSIPLMAGNYARNTGDDFMIGRYARRVTIPTNEGWCYFDGKVDEVRVSSVVPSADWIKLCYMNQRADDKLVIFK